MTPATLMVRLTAGIPNDALLKFAADAAARLGSTRVIGISACSPVQIYASPDGFVPTALIDRDLEQIDKELKEAEKSFRSALDGKVKAVEWRSTVVTYGTIADYVAEQMRAADLLITAAEAGPLPFDTPRRVNSANLVLRVGKPTLVVGDGVKTLDLRSVVVAWKDSREARRATQDALPVLKLATQVTVAEVAGKDDRDAAHARTEDVAGWLAGHGITAAACVVGATGEDAADIEAIARQLDTGLLVGGAYGHTRVREWVLGGVTKDLLLRPSRCSLVSH
jgi:nucleotide-binding universal stress UspA family protein